MPTDTWPACTQHGWPLTKIICDERPTSTGRWVCPMCPAPKPDTGRQDGEL